MKEFKVKLSADVNDLIAQFRAGSKELKKFAEGVAQADNKLEALENAGAYLAQMDAALSKLKSKHPNVFNQIFGNVDAEIKEAMAPIMKMPELLNKSLLKIGGQLEDISTGKIEATNTEMKELGATVKAVAKSLGAEGIDFKFLDGTAKAQTKANKLISILAQLEKGYLGLNKAMVGTDFGEIIPDEKVKKGKKTKKAQGQGTPEVLPDVTVPDISGSIQSENAEIAAQINELEAQKARYQEVINVFSGEELRLKTTKKTDTQQLKDLVSQFNEATSAVNRFEVAKNTSGEEYKRALGEQYRLASLIKNTMDDVGDKGSAKALDYINTDEGMNAYTNAENIIDKFESMSSKSAADIKNVYSNLINEVDSQIAGLSQNSATTNLEEGVKGVAAAMNETAASATNLDNKIDQIQGEQSFENAEQGAKSAAAAIDQTAASVATLDTQIDKLQGEQPFEKIKQGTDDVSANVEQAMTKFREFITLTQQIQDNTVLGEATDLDIGKNMAGLERAKNELKELATQGLLTAEEMEEVERVYAKANEQLQLAAHVNKTRRNIDENREDPGSYDRGFEQGYDAAMSNYHDDMAQLESLRDETARLQRELADARKTTNDGTVLSGESQHLEQLQAKLLEVKSAIEAKTAAFTAEGQMVDSVVASEVASLETLKAKLIEIANAVASIGQINLGANGNGINQTLAQLANASDNLEYLGAFNSKTGKISELFKGTDARAEGIFKNKIDFDTMFHNHPGVKTATASAGDWATFANEFDNFKRQIIVAKDEMATFDFSALTREEMQEVANAIQTELKSAVPDKQWLKDVETYGKEEATNMWNKRLTAGILEKYPNVKMSVDSTDRLLPKIQDQAIKDIRIEGIEALQSSVGSLQQVIENAIGAIRKTDEDKSKKRQEDKDESEDKRKQSKDTFTSDMERAKKSFNDYWNSLNTDFISESDVDKLATMESRLKSITNSGDLEAWKQDWNAITSEITQASNAMESIAKEKQKLTLKGISNSIEKVYKEAKINPLSANEEDQGILKRYTDLMAELNTYSQKGSSIINQEKINALKEEATVLQELINAYIQKNKVEAEGKAQAEAQKKQQEDAAKALERSLKAEENKLQNLVGAAKNAGIENSDIGQAAINEATNAWNAYADAKRKADATPDDTDAVANAKELKAAYKQATLSLKDLVAETNKLSRESAWSQIINANGLNTMGKKNLLKDTIKSQYAGSKIRFGNLSSNGNSLDYEIQNADKSWSKMTATINQAGNAIYGVNSKAKILDGTFKSLFKGSFKKMQDAFKVFTGYDLFFRAISEIRKGVGYITEIDTAMTELRKVTDATDATYAKFVDNMSSVGSEVGATVSNLINSAADWARLGYSIEEAGELAKNTAILMNVSEFDNIADATDAMTSALKAFGYEAEDSMHLVDVFNSIGKCNCRNHIVIYG